MTLREYLKINNTDNIIEQLKILGYDTDNLNVGEYKKIINEVYNQKFEDKPVKYVKFKNRKFDFQYIIHDININQFLDYLEIVNNAIVDKIDQDDNIILVSDDVKTKNLFKHSNIICATFLKERKRLFRKKLTFEEKTELFLDLDFKIVNNILFFYLNLSQILRNNMIIYSKKEQKKQEEQEVI